MWFCTFSFVFNVHYQCLRRQLFMLGRYTHIRLSLGSIQSLFTTPTLLTHSSQVFLPVPLSLITFISILLPGDVQSQSVQHDLTITICFESLHCIPCLVDIANLSSVLFPFLPSHSYYQVKYPFYTCMFYHD